MTEAAPVRLERVDFSWPASATSLFDDVSLEIPASRITALIGPNGSGKTTMIELILGWRRVRSGEVFVEGRPVPTIPGRERGRLMALVPQEENLPFAYSVLEYVLLGRAPYLSPLAAPGDRDVAMAFEALDKVGIRNLAHRSVPRLSGGERRMVLIARALLQNPRILLLDEPANHLDPANRERLVEILQSLRRDGITIVMSSHEPDMVTRLADHIVLLRAGAPPSSGSPGSMLVPERLSELYGIPVRIVESGDRRVILWGD